MDNPNMFLDVIVIIAGAFLIYSALAMKFKGEIKNSLISRNIDLSKAPDREAYIRVMFLPNIVMGFLLILSGCVTTLLPGLGIELPSGAGTGVFITALAAVVIYGMISMNAQNKYLRS